MRQSAAVLCRDRISLETLQATLGLLGIEPLSCASNQQALEFVLAGRCTTLIVDFDLPGAEEVIRMASLLPETQMPALLAVASRAWPGTGQAFQSGASRILYRPLNASQLAAQLKDALRGHQKPVQQQRKSERFEMKTMVYLEFDNRTVPALTLDISEHGLAVQATEPVPMNSDLNFRCPLPGTNFTLHGHADVIWASDQGRAGLFFSKLAPAARKHLKHWLSKKDWMKKDWPKGDRPRKDALHKDGQHKHSAHKDAVRDLLPSADEPASFAVSE
jgi:FixJ family two-component response regulator